MRERAKFKSSLGMLLALVGSAIGLGNLWRFPYVVGNNGGAAFIIIYLVVVALICLPVMVAEFVIGRRARANAYSAYDKFAPKTKWKYVGLLGVITALIIDSFYCVVGGWTVSYLFHSFCFDVTTETTGQSAAMFSALSSDTSQNLIYMLIFLGLTCGVVMLGVQKGLERSCKYLITILAVLIVAIMINSLTLEGSSEGLKFLFKPDFSKVTFKTILYAMGQGFFSLSLGCCCVLTYASYAPHKDNLLKTTSLTVTSDVLFALIAGAAILPAVFAFGISPTEGAGLAFITLPEVFGQMAMGKVIAVFFYFVLFAAAISSSISLLEIVVAYIMEIFSFKRIKAVVISSVIMIALGICCAVWGSIFNLFDYISANILMTTGGFLVALFVGWKITRKDFEDEITSSGMHKVPKWLLVTLRFLIRYVAPIGVAAVMISSLAGL